MRWSAAAWPGHCVGARRRRAVAVLRAAQTLVDLLAHRAHRELVRVTARHPDLAAQRDHRGAGQRGLEDLLLAHVVREPLPVAGFELLAGLGLLEHAGARAGPARGVGPPRLVESRAVNRTQSHRTHDPRSYVPHRPPLPASPTPHQPPSGEPQARGAPPGAPPDWEHTRHDGLRDTRRAARATLTARSSGSFRSAHVTRITRQPASSIASCRRFSATSASPPGP